MTDPRRTIPGVDALLATEAFAALLERAGRPRVLRELRRVQDALRSGLEGGGRGADVPASDRIADPAWYAERVERALDRGDRPSLRRVINATGVVLHTNLGRAPLAAAAVEAMVAVAGYSTLEYDLGSGGRGSRHDHCVALLRELTGADDALVVNNNAAAVVLALNALAEGRDALISRGELVEIGGSFRVPEIMARSGARMREVGATNRTHLRDYADAMAGAAVVLKVHRSNFRIEGFTAEVDPSELAALAAEHGVPLIHDVGSGALLDMTRLGLPPEPTARAALEAGADLVTMSGDKLLGGPQAGIILGRAPLVETLRRSSLARAFRPDKLTLAALEATLALYRDPERAMDAIPALRMLGADADALRRRAERLAAALDAAGMPVGAAVVPSMGAVGGGAYPGVELPGFAVALPADPDAAAGGAPRADALAAALRAGTPPVVGRIQDRRLLLDVRTVHPDDEAELVTRVVDAVYAVAAGGGHG